MPRILAALGLPTLAACAMVQADEGALTPCDAQHLAVLIGEPAEKLEEVPLPDPTRVVRPGEAVTMEHVPERLTVRIGARGLIHEMRCG
jgi:hypothetical protein